MRVGVASAARTAGAVPAGHGKNGVYTAAAFTLAALWHRAHTQLMALLPRRRGDMPWLRGCWLPVAPRPLPGDDAAYWLPLYAVVRAGASTYLNRRRAGGGTGWDKDIAAGISAASLTCIAAAAGTVDACCQAPTALYPAHRAAPRRPPATTQSVVLPRRYPCLNGAGVVAQDVRCEQALAAWRLRDRRHRHWRRRIVPLAPSCLATERATGWATPTWRGLLLPCLQYGDLRVAQHSRRASGGTSATGACYRHRSRTGAGLRQTVALRRSCCLRKGRTRRSLPCRSRLRAPSLFLRRAARRATPSCVLFSSSLRFPLVYIIVPYL